MNHSAKFDAASFILGGEILNRTNTHKITNKQTVTDIYPHLAYRPACVDKNLGVQLLMSAA